MEVFGKFLNYRIMGFWVRSAFGRRNHGSQVEIVLFLASVVTFTMYCFAPKMSGRKYVPLGFVKRESSSSALD
jgi:hypothetical protein